MVDSSGCKLRLKRGSGIVDANRVQQAGAFLENSVQRPGDCCTMMNCMQGTRTCSLVEDASRAKQQADPVGLVEARWMQCPSRE